MSTRSTARAGELFAKAGDVSGRLLAGSGRRQRVSLGTHGRSQAPPCGRLIAQSHLLFASAEGSNAQNLPRQLTMVVPFAAGGPSDVAGRIIAQGLSEVLGQSVMVENPAGAGGTVGSLRVSKSAPNGSQFVIGNSGTHAWSQSLYKHQVRPRRRGFLFAKRPRTGRSIIVENYCRK
jgi:hypothetical protein